MRQHKWLIICFESETLDKVLWNRSTEIAYLLQQILDFLYIFKKIVQECADKMFFFAVELYLSPAAIAVTSTYL